MFFTKKGIKAFTLVELMMTITIILIIATNLNTLKLNEINNRQKINIFTNKIITNIETLRNNSLIGRGVDGNLNTPYLTKITLTTSGSGKLIVEYNTGASLPLINNTEYSIIPEKPYSIDKIECLKIDDTSDGATSSGIISIIGDKLSLSGCPNTSRKLKVTTKLIENDESFSINVVNGLVIKD
ncbi:hypothetical protein CSB07_00220 [Candidatus Gracilibacteria bacterium]|nr:MAG: hypothetical protein CSB07_00220 [Candidatus Gracilibacteria bacterium]PIE85649.1 MAG: hypothetical protein CSA08_00930 [Candidatus Gracilibacteria bacterium]